MEPLRVPNCEGPPRNSLAAALVTGLTAVSAMPGFLRDIVIAGAFGAELDAYFGLAVLRPHHAGHD